MPKGVAVYEINGALFFGAAHKFKSALPRVEKSPRVLILRMRNVPLIDATGEDASALLRQALCDRPRIR